MQSSIIIIIDFDSMDSTGVAAKDERKEMRLARNELGESVLLQKAKRNERDN